VDFADERISNVSAEQRSYRFEHLRVPLPVQRSGGTFTVSPGAASSIATLTLRTTFDPLDPTATDDVSGLIRQAFGQSLQALRRYVEEKVPWDA
jgi:hypothetical protein